MGACRRAVSGGLSSGGQFNRAATGTDSRRFLMEPRHKYPLSLTGSNRVPIRSWVMAPVSIGIFAPANDTGRVALILAPDVRGQIA